jgi:hypothetical protein
VESNKGILSRFNQFARKAFLPEVLVVMLLGSIVWVEAFSQTITSGTFDNSKRNHFVSFLEDNLDVYDYSELDSAMSGNKGITWPSGSMNGPISLGTEEKKPYYIYNLDVYYLGYSIRLFTNRTLPSPNVNFLNSRMLYPK